MENQRTILQVVQTQPFAASAVLGGLSLLFLPFLRLREDKHSRLSSVPAVPGLPVIGNLLQLKEKKPYKTFTQLAEEYGPIYSIRTGAFTVIVLNSVHVAKEVSNGDKIFNHVNRQLSTALKILTLDKCMVAISDYNDFHKMIKKHILSNVLGANAQKRHCSHREVMIENLSRQCEELLYFSCVGTNVESIYVAELGDTLSKDDKYKILVLDLMQGAFEVDWRDSFPYLKWIPNKSLEMKLHFLRKAVMEALIDEQKKRIASGKAMLIACTAIGRLVQEFEWKLKEGAGGEDVDTVGLTTHKLHPLQVKLKPRNH
ncbi:Ent-kaurene oxidase [Spatholobus suberectus]|nr:Ent-kaurene oxidase [Spatholobus suberectus]